MDLKTCDYKCQKTGNDCDLQVICSKIPDGLLIANLKTLKFVRANQAICEMTGFSEEELIGMHFADLHPSTMRNRLISGMSLIREDETPAGPLAMLRKDGSMFMADINTSVVIYGGERCLMGFFRDMTELLETQEQLRKDQQTLTQLVKSQDHDRQLISYEIHDGFTQLATSVTMHLEGAIRCPIEGEAEAGYQTALKLAKESVNESRRLISGLRPPCLDEGGVIPAIEELIRVAEIPITFNHDIQFNRLEASLENSIYRVVQECITNILKHSGSDRAIVKITQESRRIVIMVQDWGCGFDTEEISGSGYGLGGIQERTKLFGGKATITSVIGEGTTVVAEFDNGIWEKK